jgi:hypothetical protein
VLIERGKKMAKRIMAKTGEYQKDGQMKGEYTKLGVILNNDNGEYMLLDPSVSLAGVLIKQNSLAAKSNGPQRDMLMVSIFEDDNQNQQQGGFQQQNQNMNNVSSYNQAPPQQGGFNQPGKR